jgi:hypothetical protein
MTETTQSTPKILSDRQDHPQGVQAYVRILHTREGQLLHRKIVSLLFVLSFGWIVASCGQKPAGWTMLHPATTPPALGGGAIAYMENMARAILFGGTTNEKWLDETWIWDGQDWSQAAPLNHPSARAKPIMVYDPSRNKIVLFGGVMNQTLFNDTWEWDGQNWRQMDPEHRPASRCCHAMAYDPVQKKVLLYGGHDPIQNVFFSDAWEWDGTDWTEVTCCGLPLMSGHAMIDLPDVNEVISVQTSELGTWVWDGTLWQDAQMESPPSRSEGRLAYATKHKWAVFFGGSRNKQLLNDFWILDGEQWIQLHFAVSPPPRFGHVLFHDSRRNSVILFGGYDDKGVVIGDMWELTLPDNLSGFVLPPTSTLPP